MQYFVQLVKLIPYIFLHIILLSSCEQESTDIGNEFIKIHSRLTMVDSINVEVSTVLFDSIITSGQENILCGSLSDGEFGYITAKSFFEIATPGSLSSTTNAIYDSLSFILYSNSYIYGDTTKPYEISVHQLINNYELNDDGYLYNTLGVSYNSNPLGTAIYIPRPNLKPKLTIKLTDNLGLELFNKLITEDDDITTQSHFSSYFKGLTLVPGENNQAVLGYQINDTSASLRLYYHYSNDNDPTYVDFKYYDLTKQYNQITANRTNTIFSDKSKPILEKISNETSHKAYMQGGTGIAIRIKFPTIKNIQISSKYLKIIKADLIIKPVTKTYSNTFPIPPKMVLYESNEKNNLGSTILDNSENTNYGNLNLDYFYPQNTFYSYDITNYINSLINTDDIGSLGLLFMCPDFNTSLSRLVIGDFLYPDNNISLKIYYLNYDE